VNNPTSSASSFFYVATNGTGAKIYLASNTVTKTSSSATTEELNDIKIIPSTFYMPNQGLLTEAGNWEDWFRELKFRPIWAPTITGDFSVTPVIPADERRYLSSTEFPNVIAEDTRFVKLDVKNNNNNGFKFAGSASTTASILKLRPPAGHTTSTTSSTGFTDAELPNLVFRATLTSPIKSTSSQRGVYMVVKSDWNNRTSAVSASKQLRYLTFDGTDFKLFDLYDPDVSENTIKASFYRVTNGTQVTLSTAGGGTGDTETITNASMSSRWGIKAYIPLNAVTGFTATATTAAATASTPNLKAVAETGGISGAQLQNVAQITIPTLNANSDPTTVAVVDVNTILFNNSSGTTVSVFKDPSGTTYTDATLPGSSTIYTTGGMAGQEMNIPSTFSYFDYSLGYDATKSNAKTTGAALDIIFVTEVFDKRVEELFTNVNVTLLRLVQPSSGVSATSPAAGNETNYLGLENIVPANSQQTDDGTTATVNGVTDVFTPTTPTATTGAGSKGIGLIVRDYFKFFNPARATQFKFYELGNSEYIWQANFQSGAANAYAYITVSASHQLQYRTRITDRDQRGWILEYDNTMTPPAVRLKWAPTGRYLDVAKHGVTTPAGNDLIFGTDSAPLKADGITFNDSRASAAIFNCIVCSSIDATGACMPIANPDTRQGSPAGAAGGRLRTSPVPTQVSISSPSVALIADSGAFRLAVGANRIKYALSQFSSPTAAVVVDVRDESPSPTPSDPYVSEFILTQQGGVMSNLARNKNGFFIKAANMATGQNYYLRTDPNMGTVRMVATNLPTQSEGYVWILNNSNSSAEAKYNLASFPLSTAADATTATLTNRYLQNTGATLGAGGTTSATAYFAYEDAATVGGMWGRSSFVTFRNGTASWAPTTI
jgi:hypothetical protein